MESRDRLKAGSTMNQIWLHILNPTDADKGKYVLELFDGNDTHKLSTDLSGQGKLSQQHGHGNQIYLSCSPGFLQTIGSNSSLVFELEVWFHDNMRRNWVQKDNELPIKVKGNLRRGEWSSRRDPSL